MAEIVGQGLAPPLDEAMRQALLAYAQTHPQGATGAGGGSTFEPGYGSRQMKAYPVTDGELSSVGTFRASATAAFSAMSLFLGVAINIFVSTRVSKLPDDQLLAWNVAMWIFVVLAVLSFVCGLIFRRKARSIIAEIKKTTRFFNVASSPSTIG